MEHLAAAVIDALMFFELCDDSTLHPDAAIQMSETILDDLKGCSDSERQSLAAIVEARLEAEHESLKRPEAIRFYEKFFTYFPIF